MWLLNKNSLHIILRITLISLIRVKRNSIEHSKVCYNINVARLKLNFVYPKGYLRWQGLICSRNTPNYHHPFAHLLLYPITCCAFYDDIIGIPPVCQYAGKERVRWPSALSSQYEFASIGCAYAHMLYYIWATHAHTHTHTVVYPPRECVIRNTLTGSNGYWAWGQFFFSKGGKGERDVWSGDSFVEWHNKSTEIQIVAQSHTPTTEFYGHYEIPDNDTKAAAATTEKGPHK